MANRKMIHRGTVTVKTPAVTEEVFNEETGLSEVKVVGKEGKMEMKLAPGGAFGDYPIGVPVDVPKHMQKVLKAKGFEFASKDDLAEFEAEQAKAAETQAKDLKRAQEALKKSPGGVSGKGGE